MSQSSLLASFKNCTIRFGDFTLSTQTGELRRGEQTVRIEPQLLEFLLLLIKNVDHKESPIVSRDMMVEHIWSGKSVSDDAIRAVVKKLREVLQDNARNPSYIKTIPTKGYLLICSIEVNAIGPAKWKRQAVVYGGIIACAMLFTLGGQAVLNVLTSDDPSKKRVALKTELFRQTTEFVSPHLHKKSGLLFSRYVLEDRSLQLYVKNMQDGRLKRLTWGKQASNTGEWNVNGDKILVRQSSLEEGGAHRFNESQSVSDINTDSTVFVSRYPIGIHQASDAVSLNDGELSVLGWSHQPNSLLILNTTQDSLQIVSLDLDTKVRTPLINLDAGQDNIIAVEPSANGHYLALVSNSILSGPALYIYDIRTRALFDAVDIDILPPQLIWSDAGERLSFSASGEGLYSYLFNRRELVKWDGVENSSTDLISDCGQGCFIVKQHDGDYLDIQERPMPAQNKPLQSLRVASSQHIDDFPMYDLNNNAYFITLKGKQPHIMMTDESGKTSEVFELPSNGKVESISLSRQASAFIGEIDDRIFLYRLDTGVFSFVTSINETAMRPIWLENGIQFTYAKFTQHSRATDRPIQKDIYLYSLDTASSKYLITGPYASITSSAQDKYIFVLDNGEVSIMTAANIEAAVSPENLRLLKRVEGIQLNFPRSNHIQIIDDTLFALELTAGTTKLLSLDLTSKKVTRTDLLISIDSLNFAVSTDIQNVMVVRNKQSQSTLVQLSSLWRSAQ